MNQNSREKGKYKKYVDYSHLEGNDYVKKWLENVNSKQHRLSILDKFCHFLDKTPTKIIMEHANDFRQPNPLDIKNVAKAQLKAFFGYLTGTDEDKWKNTLNDKIIPEDKKISWNSARQYVYSKLASMYKRNNVPISWEKDEVPEQRKGTIDKVWRNGKERISIDQRKECLKQIRDTFDNGRDRAILLSMISSAMDAVDLFKLKVGDFKQGYYPEHNICYIDIIRQKTQRKGIKCQTFFNSETCDLIKLYLKTRPDGAPNKSWLFISNKKNSKTGKYSKITNHFSLSLNEVCIKLNINNVTPKSLRRWFKTELSKRGVKVLFIKRMMGQAIDVEGEYEGTFDDPDEFVNEYVENIEQFTLLGNGKKLNGVDKRVNELEISNKELVEQLANSNKRVNKLEEAINKVNKILPILIENEKYYRKGYTRYIKSLPEVSDKEKDEILELEKIPDKTSKKLKIGFQNVSKSD